MDRSQNPQNDSAVASLPEALTSQYELTGERRNEAGETVYELRSSSDGRRFEGLVLPGRPMFRSKVIPEVKPGPNRVRVAGIHYYENSSIALVVTEPTASGRTLHARLEQGQTWSAVQMCEILEQIEHALDSFHSKGYGSGDLRPHRFFVSDSGEVRMLLHGLNTSRATVIGRAKNLSPRDDVHVLGRMIFKMLTGRSAPDDADEARRELIEASQSEAVAGVVARSLHGNPRERFSTAKELSRAFQQSLVGRYLTGSISRANEDHRDLDYQLQRPVNWVFWMNVTACLLIAACLLFWFATQRIDVLLGVSRQVTIQTDPEGADVVVRFPLPADRGVVAQEGAPASEAGPMGEDGNLAAEAASGAPSGEDVASKVPKAAYREELIGQSSLDWLFRFTQDTRKLQLRLSRRGYVPAEVELTDNMGYVIVPLLPAVRLSIEASLSLGQVMELVEIDFDDEAEGAETEEKEPEPPRLRIIRARALVDKPVDDFLIYRPTESGISYFDETSTKLLYRMSEFENSVHALLDPLGSVGKVVVFAAICFGLFLLLGLLISRFFSGASRKLHFLRKGIDAYNESDYERAEKLFSKTLAYDFLDQDVVFAQGLCYLKQKSYEKAFYLFSDVVDDLGQAGSASTTASLFFIGRSAFALGDYQQAATIYDRFLFYEPTNQTAMFNMGHASFLSGDLFQARGWFRGVLQSDPEDAEAKKFLARIEEITSQSGLPFLQRAAEESDSVRRRVLQLSPGKGHLGGLTAAGTRL